MLSEVDAGAHGYQPWTILGTSGAAEVRVADCAVYPKVGAVEGIESVGANLQPESGAVGSREEFKLFDDRDVIHEDRRLTEKAVVLRRGAEGKVCRNRKRTSVEIDATRVVGIERCSIGTAQNRSVVRIAHASIGK